MGRFVKNYIFKYFIFWFIAPFICRQNFRFIIHVSKIFTILFQGEDFPGLIAVIEFYLNHLDIDVDTKCTISQYMKLISGRASGNLSIQNY